MIEMSLTLIKEHEGGALREDVNDFDQNREEIEASLKSSCGAKDPSRRT